MKAETKPIVYIGSNSILQNGISFCLNEIIGYNNVVSYKSIEEAITVIHKVDVIIIDLMCYKSIESLKRIKLLSKKYSVLLLIINADDLLLSTQFFDKKITVFIDCNYLYRDLKNALKEYSNKNIYK